MCQWKDVPDPRPDFLKCFSQVISSTSFQDGAAASPTAIPLLRAIHPIRYRRLFQDAQLRLQHRQLKWENLATIQFTEDNPVV